ncbi:fatty acid alpha-hydroxylase, partial [Globomyces sp. JEL0801]
MTDEILVFTKDEVSSHHDTSSLWVIVKDKGSDSQSGMEILLQYGGQDVTDVLQDVNEHLHSDSAYEMLDDYMIGHLSDSKSVSKQESKTKNDFIDVNKPMLAQIWNRNFSKSFYLEQVHKARHCKHSAPIFGYALLDMFTRTPWWAIPIFWIPFIIYTSTECIKQNPTWYLLWIYPVGIFIFTFIEYSLHRFLFHLDDMLPDHKIALMIHFTMHGVHHFLPMDQMRLVLPPALGFVLVYPIWATFHFLMPNGIGQGITAGGLIGFVAYDMTH